MASQTNEPPGIFTSTEDFFSSFKPPRDEIWRIIERWDASAKEAEAIFRKRFLGIIFVWAIAYAISANVVSEGAVSSFKLSQLPLIVLFAPVVLAILHHDAVAIILASTVEGRIERIAYRQLFPGITRDQADALSLRATGLSLEGALTGRTLKFGGCLWLSSGVISIGLFLCPFVVLAHSSYLACAHTSVNVWAKIVVLGIALVIAARTVFLLVALFRGFEPPPNSG
jgi:hypothetical protein